MAVIMADFDLQTALEAIRWILQKESLGQDVFLIGPPGAYRRDLALKYAELTHREVEYVAISRDCTEGDLKQRREIREGASIYVDQPCVRAAVHGRILILDGIQNCERNVLPLLNNLLENREMALEDGRFLVHPKRYDRLLASQNQSELKHWKLVKVNPRFFVVALGLPVPPYSGYPLDPPFRSRFQARNIKSLPFDEELKQLNDISSTYTPEQQQTLHSVLSLATVLRNVQALGIAIPEFPYNLEVAAQALSRLSSLNPRIALSFIYPHLTLPTTNNEAVKVVESTLRQFQLDKKTTVMNMIVQRIIPNKANSATVYFALRENESDNGADIGSVQLSTGSLPLSDTPFFVKTQSSVDVLGRMLLVHSIGDFCVIGDRGNGKSIIVRHFAHMLGYKNVLIPLYKDISSRDLLQRRATTLAGDTIWQDSPLITAAKNGYIAILDGVETLASGALATLQRLIHNRSMPLPDGSLMVGHAHFMKMLSEHGWKSEQLEAHNIIRIDPRFRIVALARPINASAPDSVTAKAWLTPEICSLFAFVHIQPLSSAEERQLIESLAPGANATIIEQLLSFVCQLRQEKEDLASLAVNLSTRQLIRIARRLSRFNTGENLHHLIHKATLSRFLTSIVREALDGLLLRYDIKPLTYAADDVPERLEIEIVKENDGKEYIAIGGVIEAVKENPNALLVPNILFYENERQTAILREMLKDWQIGEHLLLVGNQGVGKNKLVDYFLQLLQREREYIQLHRDTTVQSLTALPSIKDGMLLYEDSPLIKAVRSGHVLVVDEADKAPTYVTAVLKSLIEEGEMLLGDGRRITSNKHDVIDDQIIVLHPDFRMIVLANRPGFPFLGNDFYRECGDVFGCHAVDNPDIDSEMQILRRFAPDVGEDILHKLSSAFSELRRLVDDGIISYPYSTREIVNVVRHLQLYPEEGLPRTLSNVFDFDQYQQDTKDTLITIFQKHGIPVGFAPEYRINVAVPQPIPLAVPLENWTFSSSKASVLRQTTSLALRGGWALMRHSLVDLERHEGRGNTFTEEMFSITIPSKGDMLSAALGTNGQLFIIGSAPIALYCLNATFQRCDMYNLQEYFPLQKGRPKLYLAAITTGQNNECLVILNGDDKTALMIDLHAKNVHSFSIPGFLATPACVIISELRGQGKLSTYIPYKPLMSIYILRYSSDYMTQLNILVDFEVDQLLLLHRDTWLVRRVGDTHWGVLSGVLDLSLSSPGVRFAANSSQIALSYASCSLHEMQSSVVVKVDTPSSYLGYAQVRDNSITISTLLNHSETNNPFINIQTTSLWLTKSSQLANIYPHSTVGGGIIELVDTKRCQVRHIHTRLPIPFTAKKKIDVLASGYHGEIDSALIGLVELTSGDMCTVDYSAKSGVCRVWQVSPERLQEAAISWQRVIGRIKSEQLHVAYGTGDIIDLQKYSNEDQVKDNDDKAGGSSGGSGSGDQGGEGTGGTGTDGEGGSRSMEAILNQTGRKAEIIDVGKLIIRTSQDTASPQIDEAVKALHKTAMEKRLAGINMRGDEMEGYKRIMSNVAREVKELRVMIEAAQAKNKERIWVKNQTSGDLDDRKLIEGVTGETAIYRKRGEEDPELGAFQEKPKRIMFGFDLSASMSKFNAHDGRLDRSLEVALMIMESFKNYEHKFRYEIRGHSGDASDFELVTEPKYPKNEKEMFTVLSKMSAHAQYCLSGDNTLAAVRGSVQDITKKESDEYFVVIVSDANLSQYNINPVDLNKALMADSRVHAYMIFIGTLSNQADRLRKAMPGRAFVCLEAKELPKIMKRIFVSGLMGL